MKLESWHSTEDKRRWKIVRRTTIPTWPGRSLRLMRLPVNAAFKSVAKPKR